VGTDTSSLGGRKRTKQPVAGRARRRLPEPVSATALGDCPSSWTGWRGSGWRLARPWRCENTAAGFCGAWRTNPLRHDAGGQDTMTTRYGSPRTRAGTACGRKRTKQPGGPGSRVAQRTTSTKAPQARPDVLGDWRCHHDTR
jgi:hypothetical protein